MVAIKKAKVPPLTVLQFRASSVDGNEGQIWEAIIGLKQGMVISPAIRVNERGNGGGLDLDQVAQDDESRALFKAAMAELLHWSERDYVRFEEDVPAASWIDSLIHSMVHVHSRGGEFQFHPPRFNQDPIPLKERKCWCGKVIDRSKNSYGGTCSRECDEEQQFDLHFQHMQTLIQGYAVEDYNHLPKENHLPSVTKLLRQIDLSRKKKSWPQGPEREHTVKLARAALVNAHAYLAEAKVLLRMLEADWNLLREPQGICMVCSSKWRIDKYGVFKKWQPCGACRAECARALGLKEVPKP